MLLLDILPDWSGQCIGFLYTTAVLESVLLPELGFDVSGDKGRIAACDRYFLVRLKSVKHTNGLSVEKVICTLMSHIN
jgi:hypothetical protein